MQINDFEEIFKFNHLSDIQREAVEYKCHLVERNAFWVPHNLLFGRVIQCQLFLVDLPWFITLK